MRPGLNRRTGWIAAIIGAAFCAVYLALFTYQRIDNYLFPGNELSVPSLPAFVPGTDIGVDVSLPGVSAPSEEPWTPASRMNILVLGLDRRPGEGEDQPARSDTMFVASIDTQARRLQMLAIPRDLWAEIPYGDKPGVWSEAKINAAFSYGQFYKYPGGGAAAAVAAVEHDYHIDIQHYVVIDWAGFVTLVDAIGGIDIDVPDTISDYGTDVLEVFKDQTVVAGPQHMDGKQALGYSRVRVDGDLKRIERQQLVIRAVAAQSVSLGYIAKLPQLWDAYHAAIRTDIDSGSIPGFGILAGKLKLERIDTFSLGPALYPGISEDGELILLPNIDEVYEIIDQFLADPRLRDEGPAITLEYPDGMESEAKAASAHLVAYGVPPEWIKTVTGPDGPTGIFDLTGKSYSAAKLTSLFNLRLLNPEPGSPDGVDVLVRLGSSVELKSP